MAIMVLSTDAKIVKSVVIRGNLSFFNSNNFALTEKDMCFCIYLCRKKQNDGYYRNISYSIEHDGRVGSCEMVS